MTVATIKKNWSNGRLIAIISLIECFFKLVFASTELIFGHVRNVSPNETRVFIHSMMFTVLGSFGLICALLLLYGLSDNKKYHYIIYWICLQGICIFHQMFFSVEIFIFINHHIQFWALDLFVILILILFLALEIFLLIKILNIYQAIEIKEAPPRTPRTVSSWRIPTISELLDDQSEIGQSTPPAYQYSLSNTNTFPNNTSNA